MCLLVVGLREVARLERQPAVTMAGAFRVAATTMQVTLAVMAASVTRG
jgi:hypothetical protein